MERKKLYTDWLKLKKAEEKAKNNRVAIEKELAGLFIIDDGSASKTFTDEDAGFKINIKKNIRYALDQEKWKSVRLDIPENLRPEKIAFSLDVKGFDYLAKNDSAVYQKVSDCVTISENKSTFKIEKI